MIYLDNNACVPMTNAILKQYIVGAKLGNISNESSNAQIGMNEKDRLTGKLQTMFPGMQIIYTSGGSESNSTAIRPFASGHIVCPASEHWSIIECIKDGNVTWLRPETSGHVRVDAILDAVKRDTRLVILQSVNSETGAIQKIMDLAIRLDRNIHIHCDHVQGFIKLPEIAKLSEYCTRANRPISFSVSFHKIGAPVGFGALMSNRPITPLIAGSQNAGFRGGTYNIAAMYATFQAIRDYRYERIYELRNLFDKLIKSHFVILQYPEFVQLTSNGAAIGPNAYIVMFSCIGCLPHTIFMSICKGTLVYCNQIVRQHLDRAGVIIGSGSACNSEKKDEFGGMRSADIPEALKNGFLRISMSCYNSAEDIRLLVRALSYFKN